LKAKIAAVCVLVLLLLASFAVFVEPAGSAELEAVGDNDVINVVVHFYPDVDKYGKPSVNPDGTFYPNDRFWIKYNVYIYGDANLEGVEAVYNETAFEKVRDVGWGTTSGMALFAVKADAKPGAYEFRVEAKASKTAETGASGSVKVTVGGVDVDAYYHAECMLTVSASAGGTTSPAPGSYWYVKGETVSVKAIPDANYTFSNWILDGADAGSSNPISVFMDNPHSITAVFKQSSQNQTAAQLASEGSTILGASLASPEPKLVIRNLTWTTWFDIFRGTVCQAKGYLYDSNGFAVKYSEVVVEFRKRNFWTGATWIVSKTVWTDGSGRFAAEDTCNPLWESFVGVEAWAEKPGYIPSWSLSMALDPNSAEVGQGGAFLAGVRVSLSGRYTPVPIAFSVENVPLGCSVTFDPASGEVDGINALKGTMLIKVGWDAPLGGHELYAVVSSGKVSDERPFNLTVKEVQRIPSTVTFRAHGLDSDASGLALTLDGSVNVYAQQLPYTAYWDAPTIHSYAWSSPVGSTLEGKRYILDKVVVTTRYVSKTIVTVQVVKYDPQFTLVLAYVMPKSPGNNSYEKSFAMIIRYDGNGPEKNLGQRAVIEGWDWSGNASRITAQQQLTGLTDIPDLSKLTPEEIVRRLGELQQLFNLTNGITFAAAGIDAKTQGTILKVDGEELAVESLPKTYSWPENTTHTYEWSVQMPVYVWVEDPRWGTGHYEEASDEWFSFEYALVSLPQFTSLENATLEQLQQQALNFSAKLYSPSGNITSTAIGNRVTGVYSHDKLLKSIAEDAGVSYGVLKCLEPMFPVFFSNESRYAKFVFDLDDRVADEAISQLFNTSLRYTISFMSSMFSAEPRVFKANFTCPLEYYMKAVNATAFRWDPVGKKWTVDYTVRVETVFDVTFNSTEADWFRDYLKDQTVDETALEMAAEDMYECYPQYFGGLGTASGIMNRTSAFIYNLNATAGRGYYVLGSLPEPADAWTESVKTKEAWWTSATSTLSADTSTKTKGSASIRVEENTASTASAVLTLLKPVKSWPASELRFQIFLDSGCSGKVTVYVEGQYRTAAFNTVVPKGAWREVAFKGIPFNAWRVGVYADLEAENGTFWIDDLSFIKVDVWKWTESVELAKTVYVNFASDEPYTLYVNMDPLSPLQVNVTRDDCKTSKLTVDAPPELGGLANVTVYMVARAPTGYSLENIPIDKLQLKKLFTVNLTAPEVFIQEFNYSGYMGYSAIRGGVLGFSGQTDLLIIKDPEMKALPGYNATLLLIEAQNVWGTSFRTVVAVQPWAKSFWEVVFEQVAMALGGIAVAAIIGGIVVKLLRESRGQL